MQDIYMVCHEQHVRFITHDGTVHDTPYTICTVHDTAYVYLVHVVNVVHVLHAVHVVLVVLVVHDTRYTYIHTTRSRQLRQNICINTQYEYLLYICTYTFI